MDNATAEYTFVKMFFSPKVILPTEDSDNSLLSPTLLLSPDRGGFLEQRSISGSDYGGQRNRSASITGNTDFSVDAARKEAQATLDTIWKQIMDPVLGYCEVCFVTSFVLCRTLFTHHP